MKRKILAILVIAVFLCGCIAGIEGTDKTEPPSADQELTDLKKKKSEDEGATNEEKYIELKQKIMNRKK